MDEISHRGGYTGDDRGFEQVGLSMVTVTLRECGPFRVSQGQTVLGLLVSPIL
jgi:hypothetical protein